MEPDGRCLLNIKDYCYYHVAHGSSEEILRRDGRMRPCDMGGAKVEVFEDCPCYLSFVSSKDNGRVDLDALEEIRVGKEEGRIGRFVDLRSSW